MTDERRADYRVDEERLRELTNRLTEFLTSPEYLEQARWVFEAPEEERLRVAAERLSVESLRGLGLDLPDDFRISSRYFESNWPAALEVGDYPDGPNPLLERDTAELDRLRLSDPDTFWRTIIEGRPPETLQLGTIMADVDPDGPIRWGACGGGGSVNICVCGGYEA